MKLFDLLCMWHREVFVKLDVMVLIYENIICGCEKQ